MKFESLEEMKIQEFSEAPNLEETPLSKGWETNLENGSDNSINGIMNVISYDSVSLKKAGSYLQLVRRQLKG